jgi:predicted nucleic acid-binding protein
MTKPLGKKVKVFLDSSVLVAACISLTGGSFRLCREGSDSNLELCINQYVYTEVENALKEKRPDKAERLQTLIDWGKIVILDYPASEKVEDYFDIIDHEDAPVLAGAVYNSVQYLVSLDRKHVLTKKISKASLPFIVVTPQQFFQEHWL